MGVLKLALIVVLLVSVTGQEDPIVNEDEKILIENAVDNAQEVVEESPVIARDTEPPVTITTNKPVIVTSGRNQLSEDSLFDRKPIDTEAVNFGTADGTLNRSQWLQPTESPTSVTNEYGKRKSVSVTITTNKPVIVTSGRNQLSENSLFDGKPIDTEAVNFGTADGTLNRSQWLQPTESPTSVTNEYGNQEPWFRMLGVWSLSSAITLVIVIALVYIGRNILKRRKKKENENAKEVEVEEFFLDDNDELDIHCQRMHNEIKPIHSHREKVKIITFGVREK